MANAGRVAIVPKGDYSSSTAYKRLDLVRYNNDLYIAKKANTGVAPTDSETWMLSLENVSQTQYDNLIDGTTPVGNAAKLGGKGASEYATTADLANYLPLDGTASMNGNLSISVSSALSRQFTIGNSLRKIMLQVLDNGEARLYDYKNAKNVINLPHDGSTYTFNGTATGNLPLTGGTATNFNVDTYSTIGSPAIRFVGRSYLAVAPDGSYNIYDNNAQNGRTLLHTGNSAKVAIQESAPTDTSALWVDSTNKKTKAYIDGAWTAMA